MVCSKNLQEHLKHLQEFYYLVFNHELVLSKRKMEIGKTNIEFFGILNYIMPFYKGQAARNSTAAAMPEK